MTVQPGKQVRRTDSRGIITFSCCHVITEEGEVASSWKGSRRFTEGQEFATPFGPYSAPALTFPSLHLPPGWSSQKRSHYRFFFFPRPQLQSVATLLSYLQRRVRFCPFHCLFIDTTEALDTTTCRWDC